MKYIKSYEKVDNVGWTKVVRKIRIYKPGNYVLLYPSTYFFRTAIIIETKNLLENRILTTYKNSDKNWIGWINSSEIEKRISKKEYERIRKEELEEIEILKNADKYNL